MRPAFLFCRVDWWRVLIVGLLALGTPATSNAEADVSGTAAALRVVADGDALGAVISAVAANCHATYHSAVALDEKISGNFSGSLEVVMSRLLVGYDYLIRHNGEAIDITVFGRHGAEAVAPRPPRATSTDTPAARWR
jgi:hypothetical protein